MKTLILALVATLISSCAGAQTKSASPIIDVWAIGNAYYPAGSNFTSYEGINFSAKTLLSHNPWDKKNTPILSKTNHRFSKDDILQAISWRITNTLARDSKTHTIILYYCGHGLADLSGSTYWVPGNIITAPADTTFEFLTQKLLNTDEIIKLIIAAQEKYPARSRFIILSDCCSNRVSSKWYSGITYHFQNHQEGTVTYDSAFIKNKDNLNSALKASAELSFSDLDKPAAQPKPGNKATINEFSFIPEMIRYQTFIKNGNLFYYSSKMGEETAMVDDPDPNQLDYLVGPLARRALLYFSQAGPRTLAGLLSFLTGPEDKEITSPVLVNQTRD